MSEELCFRFFVVQAGVTVLLACFFFINARPLKETRIVELQAQGRRWKETYVRTRPQNVNALSALLLLVWIAGLVACLAICGVIPGEDALRALLEIAADWPGR